MQERLHKYEVELSEEQRFVLQQLIAKGNAPVRQQAHARMLLKIDRNAPGPRWTDEQVAEAFEMSRYTVIRIRERFVNNGLDDALNHRLHTQPRARAVDGEQEAHLIALSCSPCPAGRYACWPIAWWNWAMWSTSAMKPCARCSNKRTEAVAETMLVHSA
jgi:Homeodomain-like domain